MYTTTYAHNKLSEMLEDTVCWEGNWSQIPIKTCQIKNCFFCNDVHMSMICLMCSRILSQCHLITLHGVSRFREDHNYMYPVACICMDCFLPLNEMLTDIRMTAILPTNQPKSIYEPLKKWLFEHWNFLND